MSFVLIVFSNINVRTADSTFTEFMWGLSNLAHSITLSYPLFEKGLSEKERAQQSTQYHLKNGQWFKDSKSFFQAEIIKPGPELEGANRFWGSPHISRWFWVSCYMIKYSMWWIAGSLHENTMWLKEADASSFS